MTCLNEKTYAALLEGTLPEAERERVVLHLEESCEACERFLSEREAVDQLDGLVDEALTGIAAAKVPFDEVGFARMKRRMRLRRWLAAGGAVAAAAAVLLLVQGEPTQRFKGGGVEAVPELELLVKRGESISPIARGAHIRVGDALLFRVKVETARCVTLHEGGEPLDTKPICLEPGTHTLSRDGRALAWPAKRAGEVRFGVEDGPVFPVVVEEP